MTGCGEEMRFAHTQGNLGFNSVFFPGHDFLVFQFGNIYKWCLTSLVTAHTLRGTMWTVGLQAMVPQDRELCAGKD